MARNQRAQALARARESERKRRPGVVVITFREPVHKVPFYRGSRKDDCMRVFSKAECEVVPTPTTTLVRVIQQSGAAGLADERGPVIRTFDWADITSITVVSPLDLKPDALK